MKGCCERGTLPVQSCGEARPAYWVPTLKGAPCTPGCLECCAESGAALSAVLSPVEQAKGWGRGGQGRGLECGRDPQRGSFSRALEEMVLWSLGENSPGRVEAEGAGIGGAAAQGPLWAAG